MAERKQKRFCYENFKKTSPIPAILSPFFLFSVILAFIIAMPLVSAAYTGGRDVTLQWDESIDAPNLQSYKIYYYTTQGVVGSLNTADYALSYTLPGGTPIPINPLSDPKPITIDKSHTQITLRLDPSKNYYFAATAIDKQGLESVFTSEVTAPAIPQNPAYTVTTVPEGLSVMVDGVTYTTPKTFGWAPRLRFISVTQTKAGEPGTRYEYQSWSDGQAQFHSVTMPQASTTYTATFGKQYSLTTASNPAVGGAVTPAGVSWWNAGATTTGVTATANSGYQFTGWSGASYIDGESCAWDRDGRSEGVDGGICEAVGLHGDERSFGSPGGGGRVTYTTPKVFNWLPGTNHTIGVTSPQLGGTGTRYLYQGWSDQGAQSHTVTAPATATTYTVTFGTQHAVTGLVNPSGAGTLTLSPAAVEVEGGRSWYAVNQAVTATTAPVNAGYAFASWTGGPVTPGRGGSRGSGRDGGDGRSEVADGELQCGVHGDDGSRGVVGDGGRGDVHDAEDVWLGAGVGSLALCIITVTDEGG